MTSLSLGTSIRRAHSLEHAFVYDIDDLQRIADQNMKGRREVAAQAEGIVNEEVDRLLARLRARDVAPTIVSLQEQLESLRRNELTRFRSKLGAPHARTGRSHWKA